MALKNVGSRAALRVRKGVTESPSDSWEVFVTIRASRTTVFQIWVIS